MVAVNRLGQNLTAQEVRDININSELQRVGFTDYNASQLNGYVTKEKGYYYYDWGKVKVNPTIKRTTSGIAFIDAIQFNNTSGNSAIVKLTETYSTIPVPQPRRILGMDLNEWVGVLLSGPIDAEIIGSRAGLKIATVATRSQSAIRAAVKSGKITPDFADDLEILMIAKARTIKPKSTNEAIQDVTTNTNMSNEDKIEAIGLLRDSTLTSQESFTSANNAIRDIRKELTNIKRETINDSIGSIPDNIERIEALNNYKINTKNIDNETNSIIDDLISQAKTDEFNNQSSRVFRDESIDLESQYNKLVALKNGAPPSENTDYIESLMRDRLARIKTRDEEVNNRLAIQSQADRSRIFEEQQRLTKDIEVKEQIEQARLKEISDKAKQGSILQATLYQEDLRRREQKAIDKEKLGEGGTISSTFINNSTGVGEGIIDELEGLDMNLDEVEGLDMNLEETIQEFDIDPRTGLPYTSKFLEDAIKKRDIDPRTGLPYTSKFLEDAIKGSIPSYDEGDPINDDPFIEKDYREDDPINDDPFIEKDYREDDPINDDPFIEKEDDPINDDPYIEVDVERRGVDTIIENTSTLTNETYYNKSSNLNSKYHNIDIILERTVRLCNEVYSTTLFEKETYYVIPLEVPVLFNRINNTLYISFRGTKSYQNIFSDLLLTSTIDSSSNYLYSNDFFSRVLNFNCLDIQFHQGFLSLLSRIYGTIKLEIDKYITSVSNIVLTGHSLGGAMSAMFYYMYVNDISQLKIPIRWCVTYGCPRFLFIEGYNLYTEKCPHVIRVYNNEDLITYLPFEKNFFKTFVSGYIHVGQILNVTGENAPNNINKLLTGMIKNNRANITNLTKSKDDTFIFDLFEFLLSPNYLNMVLSGVVECVTTVSIDKDITGPEIETIVDKLNTDMEFIRDYTEKCILTKRYGILETLLNDNINLKNIATNKSMSEVISGLLSSYTGNVLINSVISRKAHDIKLYKLLIDNLVNIESEIHNDIFEISKERKKIFYESLEESNTLIYVEPKQPIVYGLIENIEIDGIILVEF